MLLRSIPSHAASRTAAGVRSPSRPTARPGFHATPRRYGVATYGRLDAAFNNASAGPMQAPLAEIDVDEFDRDRDEHPGAFLGMKFQIRRCSQTAAADCEHGLDRGHQWHGESRGVRRRQSGHHRADEGRRTGLCGRRRADNVVLARPDPRLITSRRLERKRSGRRGSRRPWDGRNAAEVAEVVSGRARRVLFVTGATIPIHGRLAGNKRARCTGRVNGWPLPAQRSRHEPQRHPR